MSASCFMCTVYRTGGGGVGGLRGGVYAHIRIYIKGVMEEGGSTRRREFR